MAETKLIAVNQMLDSIGERRVNSLGANSGDAALAEQILDEVNKEIQAHGWFSNILKNLTLEINPNNDELILPAKILKIKQIAGQTPIVLVGGRAFDKLTNKFTFTTTVTADVTVFREFEDISFPLRVYITKVSGKRFHQSSLGSIKIDQFNDQAVAMAKALAKKEDSDTSQRNILTDNITSRSIINRNSNNLRLLDFRFPTSQTLPPVAP